MQFSRMSVGELQVICLNNGESTAGTRPELVARVASLKERVKQVRLVRDIPAAIPASLCVPPGPSESLARSLYLSPRRTAHAWAWRVHTL